MGGMYGDSFGSHNRTREMTIANRPDCEHCLPIQDVAINHSSRDGHGPVTTRAAFAQWRKDIDSINVPLRTMIKDGKTKYDMAKTLMAEFGREAGGRSITGSLDGDDR